MDYFTDVYLKRLNKYGDSTQSRIHGRMECDFENKLSKSVNKVELFGGDSMPVGIGILETKKISEKETLDYLLTRITDNYPNGFIFQTQKPFSEEKQSWMIVFKEQYQTIGYNRYIVILLENELSWIGRDGLVYTSFVHYIGEMNGKIKDQFKVSNNVALATPGKVLTMICPKNKGLTRDVRINISEETWRVCGIDKISVPGVMYVTLEEDYVQKTELANEQELDKWSITSTQGTEIVATFTPSTTVEFYCSYDGVLTNEPVVLKCDNNKVIIQETGFNKYLIYGGAANTVLKVSLKNAPRISQDFSLVVNPNHTDWMAIVGPDQIKLMQTVEFELATSLSNYTVDVTSENDCFKIDRVEGNKVYLQGINIGNDNILVTYNGETFSTPLKVVSPWM